MKPYKTVLLASLGFGIVAILCSIGVYFAYLRESSTPSESTKDTSANNDGISGEPSAATRLQRILDLRIRLSNTWSYLLRDLSAALNDLLFRNRHIYDLGQADLDRLKVVIDRQAFEAQGVEDIEKTKITLNAGEDVSIGEVLRHTLKEIGATYEVVDDYIKVIPVSYRFIGATITLKGHTSDVRSVSWSPDGKAIASASDDAVKLWDATTGKESATFPGHPTRVLSLSWIAEGKTLASIGINTLKLWDVATGKELFSYPNEMGNYMLLNPEGTIIACTIPAFPVNSNNTFKLIDAATGRELAIFKDYKGTARSLSLSPDGKTLASAIQGGDSLYRGDAVILWDVATRKEKATFRVSFFPVGDVQGMTWSPDSKILACEIPNVGTGLPDVTTVGTRLYDVTTGGILATHRGYGRGVWSPDGKTIALAGTDGTVKLWDVANGKEVATLMGDKGHVASISWSPDGRALAAGIRARFTTGVSLVRLWDAATGKELASLPQLSVVHSVSWSPDGRRLVACVTKSGVGYLKLWDINLQK